MTGPFGTTAGPWLAAPTYGHMLNEYNQTFGITQSGEANLIAGCFGDCAGGETVAKANAKAIAQVPAMLALVDAVADWVNIEDVRDMAHAIISELEGE